MGSKIMIGGKEKTTLLTTNYLGVWSRKCHFLAHAMKIMVQIGRYALHVLPKNEFPKSNLQKYRLLVLRYCV